MVDERALVQRWVSMKAYINETVASALEAGQPVIFGKAR